MVRCLLTIIITSLIIISGAIYENYFIHSTFDEMHIMLDEVHQKLENEQATVSDIIAVQDFWITKKKHLHAYIPHTEIKEVDLWISECVTYTKYQKFDDAEAKIEVVRELCEQIPKSFLIKIENIF
ncbi:MAG: DUF4363 family protein [Clostridia bacterium]|nr:DUF4363 family protein [Clostridia bacterium]